MIFWIITAILATAVVAVLMGAMRRAGGRSGVAFVMALAIIAITLGVYGSLGTPDLPDLPHATRSDPEAKRAQMQGLLDELARKMEADPTRLDGWLLLARSNARLGNFEAAGAAFKRARALAPDDASIASAEGEALIQAGNGVISDEAREALTAAHDKDGRDPTALFYLGHDAASRGDHATAVQDWTDLAALAPPDADWLADLRDQIAQEAEAGHIDPATVTPRVAVAAPPQAAPGPSADDMSAAANMAPEERAAFIRSMVDRLAAKLQDNPNDRDGWLRLARAWRVLGETQKADEAEARAKAIPATAAQP